MKEKKPTTEEFWQEQPQTYQTGSTAPPKSYGGIIAFLLVLVIFLCGISTALGLMNIRLFRQLSSMDAVQESGAVAFAEAPKTGSAGADETLVEFSPGFTGQSVPDFWQHYHGLPQGVYITQVDPGSTAQQWGLQPGDVLTRLAGVPVTDTETLLSLLEASAGQSPEAEISRDGNTLILSLTID